MVALGPKMLTDANRRLAWVPTLANYHSPTLAEITAGLDLSCLITAADFSLGSTGDDQINDPAYCSSTNSTTPGRTNYEAAMNFFRFKNGVDDLAWSTFTAKGLNGYLVERIGQIPDGTKAHEQPWQSSEEVRVFQVITGTPQVIAPASASYEKFREVFSVQDLVDERAVIGGTAPNATAVATIASGGVTAVTVTNGGSGYASAPTVSFTGGAGTGAAATATVSGGEVTGVTVTAPGTGYTGTPTVVFTRV